MNVYEQKINDQRFLIETLRAVADKLEAENKQQAAEIERLKKLLRDALPHIECRNDYQSGLITKIGETLTKP